MENISLLPEQFFDTGEPDSATPLAWPHALRLATVALMDECEISETGHDIVSRSSAGPKRLKGSRK